MKVDEGYGSDLGEEEEEDDDDDDVEAEKEFHRATAEAKKYRG